jgi:hypothetical protein
MVIKAIERIAEDQGFKSLKFKNCKGTIFHDADWIAGVDYDENIQQQDDSDEDFDENNNDDPDEDIDDNQYDRIDKDELEDLSKQRCKKGLSQPTSRARQNRKRRRKQRTK